MDFPGSSMRSLASIIPRTHELFDAVASQSIQGIVRLYSSEQHIQADARDHEGNTILHIACKGGNLLVVRTVLILFEHKYGLAKKKNKLGLRPFDITDKIEIKKSLEIFDPNSNALRVEKPHSLRHELQKSLNAQFIRDILQSPDEKTTVMLALDGGGIRGIVLLQLLMNLERRVGESIYKHVDWVAGTSTGSIVAFGIGLNKSLEDNLKVYLRLKNEIFCNSRPYNCNRYETYLKFIFGARTKMSEIKDHKIVVTACQSNLAPPKLKLYRNYQPTSLDSRDLREYEYEDPDSVHIWKAARASSAAPTYFLPFEGIYSDGGIMANNPSEVLLTEYYRYKQIQEYVGSKESPPPLACLISLGTGMVTPVTISSKGRANDILKFISRTTEQIKNMAMVFIKQITASDGLPVEKAKNWMYSNGVPYFRFSPPLSQKVDLDENRDVFIMQMMWDTEVYMATECPDELEELAKFLQNLHPNTDITPSSSAASSKTNE